MSSLRKLRDWMPPYTSTSSPLVSSKESLLLPIVLAASVFLQEYESQPVVVKEWIQRETETENGSCLVFFFFFLIGSHFAQTLLDPFLALNILITLLANLRLSSQCANKTQAAADCHEIREKKKIFDSHWVPGFFYLV
jgi:hypothetical protein